MSNGADAIRSGPLSPFSAPTTSQLGLKDGLDNRRFRNGTSSGLPPERLSSSFSTSGDGDLKRRKLARTSARTSDGSNRFEVTIDLPVGCLPGLPGCRERRRKWIAEQVAFFQRQRNTIISNHILKGSTVTLSGYELPTIPHILPIKQNLDAISAGNALDIPTSVTLNPPASSGSQGAVETQSTIRRTHPSPTPSVSSSFKEGLLHLPVVPCVSEPTFSEPAQPITALGARKFRSGVLTIKPRVDLLRTSPPASLDKPAEGPLSPPDLCIPTADDSNISEAVPRYESPRTNAHEPILFGLDIESCTSLATQPHEKARRLLLSQRSDVSYRISTHGSIDHLKLIPTFRQTQKFISTGPLAATIDDACLLNTDNIDCLVLAHAGSSPQLSLVTVSDDDKVSTFPLDRPFSENRKPGVGAVAPLMQGSSFVSGGHDHIVHLWSVDDKIESATPESLAIRHKSLITALLAIEDTSHKLVSAGADCTMQLYDLSSERVVNIVKASNYVYHVHSTDSPFCTLLEVAHHETQFELRDHRLIPHKPVERFGYPSAERHGRFIKGDTFGSLFACGSREGHVRLWDFRNLNRPPLDVLCWEGQKLVQTVFASSRLAAMPEDPSLYLLRHSIHLS